jgi:hypothetical protein
MISGRSGHASVYVERLKALYVFGGGHELCEKFDGNKWAKLAELPQSMFRLSCTEYDGQIYVAGSGSTLIQRYSIAEDVFTSLSTSIPDQGATVSVWKSNLYIFQAKYITRISLDGSEECERSSNFSDYSWWSFTALPCDDMLYFVMVGNQYLW